MNNTPSDDEFFMRHAYLAATKSKDPRTKIGAVLVKDREIISQGFNGFPRKVNDLDAARWERPRKYDYVAHAEHNSVLNCARKGISSLGATCYTNGLPCNK